jgi:hypothetical protein
MFPGYFVTHTLNRLLLDVPLHVCADVCLAVTSLSRCDVHSVISTSRNVMISPIIRLRQRSSGLDVLHPETTSTRIPILSP